MWQRPRLLNAIADLLIGTGALILLLALGLWLMQQPVAPIRSVWIVSKPVHAAPVELEEAIQSQLNGNFLSVSLSGVRRALENVAWVRRASVRRVWPGRLVVEIEEHRPLAYWGASGSEWLNSFGEIFSATLPPERAPRLPRISGSRDAATELLRLYSDCARILAPLHLAPTQLSRSSRNALDIVLSNGLILKLGREQPTAPLQERLARFVAVYPTLVANREPKAQVADLRYPNGFTLTPKKKLPRIAPTAPAVRSAFTPTEP